MNLCCIYGKIMDLYPFCMFSHFFRKSAKRNDLVEWLILLYNKLENYPSNISRMPRHSCCEMRVMQCMTYFFCASLQSCRRLYQMGDWLPPLILICCSPPTEVGVISHLIYLIGQPGDGFTCSESCGRGDTYGYIYGLIHLYDNVMCCNHTSY